MATTPSTQINDSNSDDSDSSSKDITLSPTMNLQNLPSISPSSSVSASSSSTSSFDKISSTYSASSTYIPNEWDYEKYRRKSNDSSSNAHETIDNNDNNNDNDNDTNNKRNDNSIVHTMSTTAITDTTNNTLDNNITRIIYCYTIIHLNTTASTNIQKYVNESIVNSFISIVTHMQQHTNNSNTKDQDQQEENINLDSLVNNNENVHIDNNWKIINSTSDYYIPISLSKSLSLSDNGKYAATAVYVTIQTLIPSLVSQHDKHIFKDILLSKHITTYIGNKLKKDTDDAASTNVQSNNNNDSVMQSSFYWEPKKVIKQYELSITTNSDTFIDITSDLENKDNHNDTTTTSIDKQYVEMHNLLIKLKNYWNTILSNNMHAGYSLDVTDNITLTTCSSNSDSSEDKNNDCNLNKLLKYQNENKKNKRNKDDEMRAREKKRYQPFNKGNSNDRRHLYSRSSNTKEEQNKVNTNNNINFYYILLPLNITFEYYIPNKYIDYENIFYSMEDMLIRQNHQLDNKNDDDLFWIDFYKNLLLILGYNDDSSNNSSSSMIVDVSLSYKSQNIRNNDKNKNKNNDGYIYDDDLNLMQPDYYYDPTIFKDILQSFIAMFVILGICLILVYCGKCQDRRQRQKVVPFDGSIPQEI